SYIKAVGRENTKRVLILVTDADVSTEKFSEVAAKTQQEEGVRVIVVGRDTSGESTDVVVKGLNRHGRLVVTPSFVGTTTPIEELILTFTNRASGFKQPCGWLGYFALYVLIRALSR
uniref:VWFA domain-containing protein n=2 Tax=Ciona intestinalis TaxID=7719 RepID=H2XV56_CIOIN